MVEEAADSEEIDRTAEGQETAEPTAEGAGDRDDSGDNA